MGYTTDFNGGLTLDKKLTPEQKEYINKFSDTRRMRRDISKLMEMYDGKFGHPTPKSDKPEDIYGNDGEYFIGGLGFMGQDNDASVLDFNTPPNQNSHVGGLENFNNIFEENQRRIYEGVCQPGLWCQWVIEDDLNGNQILTWNGGEKFYNYVEWLKYLIIHFFERWGVKLNGRIQWQGEEIGDVGVIIVKNNEIKVKEVNLDEIE